MMVGLSRNVCYDISKYNFKDYLGVDVKYPGGISEIKYSRNFDSALKKHEVEYWCPKFYSTSNNHEVLTYTDGIPKAACFTKMSNLYRCM